MPSFFSNNLSFGPNDWFGVDHACPTNGALCLTARRNNARITHIPADTGTEKAYLFRAGASVLVHEYMSGTYAVRYEKSDLMPAI